jgi:hypothetical protein
MSGYLDEGLDLISITTDQLARIIHEV